MCVSVHFILFSFSFFVVVRSFKLILTGQSILLFQVFGAIYEHNLALLHVHERARAIVRTFYSLTIPLNNARTQRETHMCHEHKRTSSTLHIYTYLFTEPK